MEGFDQFASFISDMATNKIAQFGFLFTLAAWIHSGRVKKEIKENFRIFSEAASNHATEVTAAINRVAEALGQDLERQSQRLDRVEDSFDKLSSRVQHLESK